MGAPARKSWEISETALRLVLKLRDTPFAEKEVNINAARMTSISLVLKRHIDVRATLTFFSTRVYIAASKVEK